MAKLRLTKDIKEDLLAFARQNVTAEAEEKAFKDAYEPARDAIVSALITRFPAKDMAVLMKYDNARVPGYSIHIANPEGKYGAFEIFAEPVLKTDPRAETHPKTHRREFGHIEELGGKPGYYLVDTKIPAIPMGGLDRAIPVNDTVFDLVHQLEQLKHNYQSALADKLSMYKQLITASRYAEDIVDVWPACKVVLPDGPVARKAIALSADALAAITRDNAGA